MRHWWVLYALLALAGALGATFGISAWFTGTDAAWLAWVSGNVPADAVTAPAPGVGWSASPLAAAAWKIGFGLFGWNYGPYQFCHVLMWFATVGLFAAMLVQLWGRRRPAVVSALVAGLMVAVSAREILQLAYLPLTAELLVGFGSVALAAGGWRRRKLWMIGASLPILALACAGSPVATIYLPALHVGAALVAWYRRESPAWLAMTLTGVAVVAVGSCWTLAPAVEAWSFVGAAERWGVHRELAWSMPAGLILSVLAGVAGLAQAMRLQWNSWLAITALGLFLAVACVVVDPLAAVLVLTFLSPRGWPFAVWATAQTGMILFDRNAAATASLTAGFACTPVMVIAIWRSPMAIWVSRFLRKLDPTGRKLIYSAGALGAILLAAHSDQWIAGQIRVLDLRGQRRMMHGPILQRLDAAARGDRVMYPSYADMGLDPKEIAALPTLRQAELQLSFTPAQYADLLAARGRADLRPVHLLDGIKEGDWLVLTSKPAGEAVVEAGGALGELVLDLSSGDLFGGLWRYKPPATQPTQPAPTRPATPPATGPATTGPARPRPVDQPATRPKKMPTPPTTRPQGGLPG